MPNPDSVSRKRSEELALPKVTVGVCVRNSDSVICEAIESILEQDYPHELMEIIFVDDGSKDDTLAVIRSYIPRMDMNVRVFHHEWKGLGYSRNVVVNNASGNYIIWVDGDMMLPKDHARKQVEFIERNPKVGIAKARYGTLDNENLASFLENISYVAVDQMYGGRPSYRTLGTGGSIYRVNAIRQVGGFDDNITGVGEDMDAESRVSRAGWLLFLGSPAFFYERRRSSLRSLWNEGFWHGYGGDYVFRKNRRGLTVLKMTPMAGLVAGAWYSIAAYRLVHKKTVFLLPFHLAFLRIAWCLGFLKGKMDQL